MLVNFHNWRKQTTTFTFPISKAKKMWLLSLLSGWTEGPSSLWSGDVCLFLSPVQRSSWWSPEWFTMKGEWQEKIIVVLLWWDNSWTNCGNWAEFGPSVSMVEVDSWRRSIWLNWQQLLEDMLGLLTSVGRIRSHILEEQWWNWYGCVELNQCQPFSGNIWEKYRNRRNVQRN